MQTEQSRRPAQKADKVAAIEFCRDPVSRAEWARVAALFEGKRVLTEGDRAALTAYASLFARHVQIQQEMQAPEFRLLVLKVTVDGAGNEHVRASENPLVAMERRTLTANAAVSGRTRADALEPNTADRQRSTQRRGGSVRDV